MTSTNTDIIGARYGGVALKAPCAAATTGPIALDGLQTLDGVALEADDRALVKDQADARENGIYVASTGLWQRAVDFDGSRDVVKGTRVSVTGGASAALEYQVISDNEIVVGEDDIVFRVFAGDHGGISAPGGDPYVINISEEGTVIAIDASAGARTVTLPSAAAAGNGAEFTVIKSDQSANFVTVNSVNGELLGYPSKQYSFHGTPATAVTDNGSGFVRVRMSEENRVFMTGDLARISGVVGFDDLNADHVVTRPTTASGASAHSIDLPVPYVAGYTSGGIVEWVQTTQELRVCNGTVTYVSNGTHWVVKNATADLWQGPKDFLFGARNSTYAGPTIPGVGVAGAAGLLDAYYNAFSERPIFRSVAFIENSDPVDLIIGRMNREGLLSDETATSITNGVGVGAIYAVGSTQTGAVSTRLAAITFIAGEDITTAGSGGMLRLGTTPVGETATVARLEIMARGETWIGGSEHRGALMVEPSLVPAETRIQGAVNAADGDTITIDAVVYTFRTTPTVAYDVDIGATAKASLENLAHAVNLTGTAGTTYGTGTAVHPTVHAIAALGGNSVMNIYAKTPGVAGNAIAVSESSPYAWDTSTLTGGLDQNETHLWVQGGPDGTPRVLLTANSSGSGAPTHVGLRLAAKETAYVHTDDPLVVNTTANAVNVASNDTYTAAQMLGGILVRDCNGAGRTDTLPTAALLVAAIPGVAVGDTVRCYIVNGSDAAETITIQEGAGGGWNTSQTAASRVIPQNTSKVVHLRLTNVTAASEAYVVYA